MNQVPESFAADVNADVAAFMADSQLPWGLDALNWRGQPAGVEDKAYLVSRRHR